MASSTPIPIAMAEIVMVIKSSGIFIENYITKDIGFKKDSFHTTGMLVLYNNMLQSLFDSQIKTIIAVFLMISLIDVEETRVPGENHRPTASH
jgi:hypothetical protein